MNEFFNNEQENPIEQNSAEQTTEEANATAENVVEESDDQSIIDETFGAEYSPIYNPVNYTEPQIVNDYKPMSKGLKVFTVILALIIALTGSCLTGYFVGRNSVKTSGGKNNTKPVVDLASKPADTDEMTAAQVYEKVTESVVGILIYNNEGKMSQASGIVFSKDGYIVTNDHIYAEIPSAKFKIYTHDKKEYNAKYVAGDQISDLAVLKIDADGFTPAIFANSDELYYGQNVVAVGRPSDALDASSITDGIISAINRRISTTSSYNARLIQTSCPINPGSSGGALVNMYGQVVGVTSSKLVSTAYDNVGYAIPTTIMKRIVDELISEGKVVSRAKLGITYNMIDSVTAEITNQKSIGIRIASVAEDSGLYGKAEENDIITHINGQKITDDSIVLDIIEEASAGDTITVTIITSKGAEKTVDAVLKANIGESSYSKSAIKEENSSGGGVFDFPEGE